MLSTMRFSLVAALILSGAAVAGCGEDIGGPNPITLPPPPPPLALGIDPSAAVIKTGEKLQFRAQGSLVQSVPALFAISWTSSNPQVAEVTALGLLTAKGLGSTVVTVTIAGQSASANVLVESNVPRQGPNPRRRMPLSAGQ
jgi:hypothetical protein